MLEPIILNGYKTYPFKNKNHFLRFLEEGNWNNILVALNAEKLVKEDERLKKLINENIGYPDGMGTVLALKKKGKSVARIPGSEFWLDIVSFYFKEKSFYLVGGKSEVIKETVKKLYINFPGINIANYRDGYMNEQDYEELLHDITEKKPDIVFVAMGSPKQEFIMEEMYQRNKALYMGLGGSFDIFCGIKKRAPKFLQKTGMEWSYRLFKEPGRIFRQTSLIEFFYKLIRNKL